MEFKAKQAITIFLLNGLAMTSVMRIIVEEDRGDTIVFKESPRKRKKYVMKKEKMDIVFDGHTHPVKADSDASVMRGNACYNLVSNLSSEQLRTYIEENALNKIEDKVKASIFHFTPEQASDSQYEENISNVLYPEFDFSHAVVEGAKSKDAIESV